MSQLYEIYQNMYNLLLFRKYEITTKMLNKDDFLNDINDNQYIIIKSIKDKDKKTSILFNINNTYTTTSNNFSKIIKIIKENKSTSALLIKENADKNNRFSSNFGWSVNLLKNFENLKNIYVECYDYIKLIINFPKHINWIPHEIVDEDDEQFFKSYKIKKNNLQKIKKSDTAIIWIGAKVGDIVKITRPSETAGISINYRLVIP